MKVARIATRALAAPFSPIRKLHKYAEQARRRGIEVLQINIGQPDFPTPPEFFRQIARYKGRTIAYAPSAGYREVIQAWQAYYKAYGTHFSEDEIVVTTGGSEAITFALATVADPGDEVLVFEPAYPNYISLAYQSGVVLKPVLLDREHNFHLPSRREITRHISKRTKAVIINNPANPTGTVFSRRELAMIIAIAQQHNLFIIADEVYREFVFDGKKHVSLMDFPAARQRVILVDSVSKRFNLCGARIGCLASKNKDVMEATLKFAQGRLSTPTLEQLAVIPLLKHSRRYTQPVVREYRRRRDVVVAALSRMLGGHRPRPEGAFYAIIKLPVADTEHFSRWLLQKFDDKKQTVMLAPGTGFYATAGQGHQEVRIAYVLSTHSMARAMVILEKAIERYHRQFS